MILLCESNDTVNIIRVITGPESDVTIGMFGAVTLDITPMLAYMDKNKPVLISVSHTAGEAELLAKAENMQMTPPFMAPMTVISMSKVPGSPACSIKTNKQSNEQLPDETALIVKSGKCSYCGTTVNKLICVEDMPGMCSTCYKINIGLNKGKKQ